MAHRDPGLEWSREWLFNVPVPKHFRSVRRAALALAAASGPFVALALAIAIVMVDERSLIIMQSCECLFL